MSMIVCPLYSLVGVDLMTFYDTARSCQLMSDSDWRRRIWLRCFVRLEDELAGVVVRQYLLLLRVNRLGDWRGVWAGADFSVNVKTCSRTAETDPDLGAKHLLTTYIINHWVTFGDDWKIHTGRFPLNFSRNQKMMLKVDVDLLKAKFHVWPPWLVM